MIRVIARKDVKVQIVVRRDIVRNEPIHSHPESSAVIVNYDIINFRIRTTGSHDDASDSVVVHPKVADNHIAAAWVAMDAISVVVVVLSSLDQVAVADVRTVA